MRQEINGQFVKITHGGRRPGSGRKPKSDKRLMVAIRLPADLVEQLRKEPDQTALIEQLLRKHYGLVE